MNRKEHFFWFLLLILCAAGVTILLLSGMVLSPGNNMVDLYADTGKNYYTFIYHCIYDHGLWFQGMNYPYGEHIIYADGQPIISSFINSFFHLDARGALATMNLLIACGFFFAIIFTYNILRRFGVNAWAAIIFASLIILLSPQVMRLRGHFALAYPCFIPMIFYMNIRYHDTRKWIWLVLLFITGYIMSFIHLYFGAIVFFWLAFYITGSMVIKKGSLMQRIGHVLPMLVLLICLLSCIKASIYFTDPVTDRPAYPWGFSSYVTQGQDLLVSCFSPVWQLLLQTKILKQLPDAGEGYGYLGMVTIVVVLASVVIKTKKAYKKETTSVADKSYFPAIWFFIAIGTLLLAMGLPFVWHMEWLLNYLSVFKQFRSMGRVNWIFFYIISIYAVVTLYKWFEGWMHRGKYIKAYVFLSCCVIIWSVEASGYLSYTHNYMKNGTVYADKFFHKNELTWPDYLARKNYGLHYFQSILLLPFFANGSEKLWIGDDLGAFSEGITASVQMQLPIIDIMMSRTSWSETEKQAKTIAGPYAEKPMLADLKDNRPFLLLVANGSDINKDEAYLIQASDHIGNEYDMAIYACYPERIIANDKKYADSALAIVPYMHSWDTCLVNKGPWYVNHMDINTAIPRMFGNGAAAMIKETHKTIDTIPVNQASADELYEFSCWFLVTEKDFSSPYVTLHFLNEKGNITATADALTKRSIDTHGLWFRDFLYFKIPAGCKAIACELMAPDKNCYSAMDELMLRPADATIISKSPMGEVMVNNHLLIPKKNQIK